MILFFKVFFVCFGAFFDFAYPFGVEGKNLRPRQFRLCELRILVGWTSL